LNSVASRWLKVANPPRSGCAGPMMMTRSFTGRSFLQSNTNYDRVRCARSVRK
jgi:hypothetical protein